MIIKGASRAAPSQLARHLGRTDTNERVDVLELQSPAGTPLEAFRDWQALADGTRGTKGLYHANIDPDAQYSMTPEQWRRAVDVLEEELGLTGQPRAVVLHEKNGREHIHVVWARTDLDTMTLRSDSHNYQAHERASARLEREFGHEHVPGKHAKRDREAQPEMPSAEFNHAEWQQAERSGVDPRTRKAEITALFAASDNGRAFRAALEDAGYIVARGDRRDFVLIDSTGDVISLRRQISGVTAKDLRAFMADVPAADLPSVDQARLLHQEQGRVPVPEERAATAPQDQGDDQRTLSLRQALAAQHAAELAEQERQHAREVTELQERQQARADEAFDAFARQQAQRSIAEREPEPGAFERLWRNIREAISEEARVQRLHEEARKQAEAEDRRNDEIRVMVSGIEATDRAEIQSLIERQGRERADLLHEHERDMARRIAEDERARQIAREYEERRREAETRQRDGPERDPRAR